MSTVVLLSVALTCVAVNLVHDRGIFWSLYVATGVGVAWLFITLVVIFARRPVFVIVGQALATAGFLGLIDLFDGALDWFVPLAMPIVAVVSGTTIVVWLVARLSRRAPALIAASVLLGATVASVGLDLLISARLGTIRLSWSLIVLSALVPPMAFLVYFHFWLSRRIHLESFLHS